MSVDLTLLKNQTVHIVKEVLDMAKLSPGQILVVGCSTSEILGAAIGSAGSTSVAGVILDSLQQVCSQRSVHLAVQCCEHLNRALVIEEEVARSYHLDEVMVRPIPKAGGALAAQAMRDFDQPVVVEAIKAHAGLDIGGTLIGMHLKVVAVPLRLTQKKIGQAFVTAARTRAKLIGGPRAVYHN